MEDKRDFLVTCHIYYYPIWKSQILPKLKGFYEIAPFDLFVSFTNNEDRTEQIKEIQEDFPDFNYKIIPNLGEDVRGFMAAIQWLRDTKKTYTKVLKIHTKSEFDWLKDMLDSTLVIDKDFVKALYNPEMTFCSSEKHYRTGPKNWAYFNAKYLDELRRQTNCEFYTHDHFSGTMFWIDWAVVEKYFINSELKEEYFNQPYAIGYTKQHSFELLMGCIAHDCHSKILLL